LILSELTAIKRYPFYVLEKPPANNPKYISYILTPLLFNLSCAFLSPDVSPEYILTHLWYSIFKYQQPQREGMTDDVAYPIFAERNMNGNKITIII
jgi:hypothetical protein